MRGQDIVTLGFTFFVGLVAGAYLYVVGFAPQVESIKTEFSTTFNRDATVTIEGHQFGRCEQTGACASFRVADGDYTAVPYIGADTESGRLLRSEWQSIVSFLAGTDIASGATPLSIPRCTSATVGDGYRYIITNDATVYRLDNCATVFTSNSDLGQELASLWSLVLQ